MLRNQITRKERIAQTYMMEEDLSHWRGECAQILDVSDKWLGFEDDSMFLQEVNSVQSW